ncbi:glycosyl hydrolase [Anaerobaca lacustris]|uniref:Glycosyl hydrolase n=1 Tax=Anaerobaca lacustris TaxID=3044600 RepID=A0AAW6TWW0_9BACT|nr:glycosyl hydrolase [Sedimentisphaerales bacterium M17dextr]
MTRELNRRDFLGTAGAVALGLPLAGTLRAQGAPTGVPAEWLDPPVEFAQAPFWFWNDDLSEKELLRQIEDFRAHGVHAFVIHPRAGLPRSIGWMSERMIDLMRLAIEHASERDMWVILYDEGMYPSGSSSGQVVAENPAFRTRGLVCIDLDEATPGTEVQGVRIDAEGKPDLAADQTLVAVTGRKSNGHRLAIVDRPAREGRSTIRGLHFVQDDPPRRADRREVPENQPPGADILNPESVACFIRLVYQRFYDEFGDHFGKTIQAIFTDEPSLLARSAERGMVPGTTGILEHINRFLGYDFTEHLPTLWYADEPDAERRRRDYNRAIQARLEETFYRQISEWCGAHGVALTGHPMGPDDIGHLRHFHIPGQDIVWRYIEPGKPSALEGAQSTQGKCASSAMIHLNRRRNLNEFCGAYGHNFTFEEMQWLANWLLIRGCNLLVPHAFYYSIRGPRIDERPPDVGPNSPWWSQYKPFARATSRLCWLNTDGVHVCALAILGRNDYLPWQAAKVCFQHQRDFNYLEARHLWEDARVDSEGVHLAGMHYRALIVEDDPPSQAKDAIDVLTQAGRIIRWDETMGPAKLVDAIDRLIPPDVQVTPGTPDLRIRHMRKQGTDYYLLFNEGEGHLHVRLKLSVQGRWTLLDPLTAGDGTVASDAPLSLARHQMCVLAVDPMA